jgi:hypothetical protein
MTSPIALFGIYSFGGGLGIELESLCRVQEWGTAYSLDPDALKTQNCRPFWTPALYTVFSQCQTNSERRMWKLIFFKAVNVSRLKFPAKTDVGVIWGQAELPAFCGKEAEDCTLLQGRNKTVKNSLLLTNRELTETGN